MYAMVDAIGGGDGGRRKRSDGVRRKSNAFRRAPAYFARFDFLQTRKKIGGNEWEEKTDRVTFPFYRISA